MLPDRRRLGLKGVGIGGKGRLEGAAAVDVELVEKLDILQSAGVHKGTQHIDHQIQAMAHKETRTNMIYPTTVPPLSVPRILMTCAMTAAASPSARMRE